MKRLFRNIHLYLALAAGLVIMNSCITGAIMVFEDDIDLAVHKERYFVDPRGQRLPLQAIAEAAAKVVPKGKFAALKLYLDPKRSAEVSFVLPEKPTRELGIASTMVQSPKGKNEIGDRKKGGKPGLFVYVNPYTGSVLDVYNKRQSFFFTVERLHRWLLGGPASVGKIIVGLSTLSFLIITVTGIVLWWPKNKKILLQRLKFKTSGRLKRLNHDLHVVSGFYTSIFLLIIIVTGLIMSYTWASKSIFTLTKTSPESPEPPASVYRPGIKTIDYNVAIAALSSKLAQAEYFMLRAPKDSTGIFAVNVLPVQVIEIAVDTYYVDQYSGQLIGQQLFKDKNKGQMIRSYVKPIHTGAIYGMPTKLFNFILALLTCSFPVTGVIMWLNRIRKKKKKTVVLSALIK
ncbi:MAG: putative iron-regulated rane protein [Pedobacter sp.]|jgi:uncharacterized iron-regulated membrane protein|nr:putative iron-regulated rane protein [Pedobacter sp.]